MIRSNLFSLAFSRILLSVKLVSTDSEFAQDSGILYLAYRNRVSLCETSIFPLFAKVQWSKI